MVLCVLATWVGLKRMCEPWFTVRLGMYRG
jgi:hypothetical protein